MGEMKGKEVVGKGRKERIGKEEKEGKDRKEGKEGREGKEGSLMTYNF